MNPLFCRFVNGAKVPIYAERDAHAVAIGWLAFCQNMGGPHAQIVDVDAAARAFGALRKHAAERAMVLDAAGRFDEASSAKRIELFALQRAYLFRETRRRLAAEIEEEKNNA